MSMDNDQEVLELEGKFKPAAELGLQDDQYCGLIKTLAYMEAGRLKHVPKQCLDFVEGAPFTGHFNMGNWRVQAECGTICCIAGTAEILGGCCLRQYHGSDELSKLFYPHHNNCLQGYNATPRQAAVALRHYLETGKTDWHQAMSTPQ